MTQPTQTTEKSTALNTAQSLYERMGVRVIDKVTLAVNGVDFTFRLDTTAYEAFCNDVESNNKVTPAKDYLLAIIEPSQRDQLVEALHIPNFAFAVMEKVNAQLFPKLEITLKN